MNSLERKEELRENTLEDFKAQITANKARGINKFFTIYVGGYPAVRMSDNPNEIDLAQKMVFPETDFVRIITYENFNGNEEDRVLFSRKQKPQSYYPSQPVQPPTLSGVEIENRINSAVSNAVDSAWQRWEFIRVQKELADAKAQLAQAEKDNADLEAWIDELEKHKGKIGNVHVGEIASVMVESFMRRNIENVKKWPGGAALAGLLSEQPAQPLQTPAPESKASFEPIKEPAASWWDDVQAAFTPDEIEFIQAIIAHLVEQKDKIRTVLELLIQK